MPVRVAWDNQSKTVARFTFDGSWRLEELYAAMRQHDAMLVSIDHVAHVIVDMRSSSVMPKNTLSIRSRQDHNRTPNVGIVVVLGANALVKAMAALYKSIATYNISMSFADDEDEAYEVIAAMSQAGHLRVG